MRILKIRLSDKIHAELKARAEANVSNVSTVVRQLLDQAIDTEALAESEAQLASALDTVLRPHVERLAAIGSKAAIAAGTAEWLALVLASRSPGVDFRTAHDEARKKAVAQLRMRAKPTEEDEDE